MKKSTSLLIKLALNHSEKIKTCFIYIILFCSFSINAGANWIENKSGKDISSGSEEINNKSSDSLHEKTSEEWFKNLKDDKGTSLFTDDPGPDALQRYIFKGQTSNSLFGASVKNAGDVNGDGYDDLIVGAWEYNSSTGRAYIFYGGQIINTVPDITLNGEATGNLFGYSVSTAGDVNGDGYSDVIVGAIGYSNKGRAYIYYGGQSMNNVPDVIMTGQTTGESFGICVSNAGDVNGDGYSDVIVGASNYSSSKGRSSIFFGGLSMNNTADVVMAGEAAGNFFGFSVASAGDVNGDGFYDVISGAYGYSSSTGRAYIFFGGASPDSIPDVIMTGKSSFSNFGYSVAPAGDVNGDGYSDVVSGAYLYSSGTGRVYIYYGSPLMNDTVDVVMTGESSGIDFGISVSAAGDINGDGFSDVIAGASGYSSDAGKVYVFLGSVNMDDTYDFSIEGETQSDFFGKSVSYAGDVNGDGYSDIIAGASGYSGNTGRAYLYDYFLKNEITYDFKNTGTSEYENFGFSVSSAGDVNGDGFSDVIIGAFGNSATTGNAYIYFGNNFNVGLTLNGFTNESGFGYSVASAGDVNGDGFSDVIVGAPKYGYTYLYLGGSVMNKVADVIFYEGGQNGLGNSVSSAGDVNGDGFSDIIIGAASQTHADGAAYIYYGGNVMDSIPDVILTGENLPDVYFGKSVSCAGDVNGDGYSDVVVGAPYYQADRGRAYIYFGGSPMNNGINMTMTGIGSQDNYGMAVSGAGDLNKDGYSDVIVGAPFANNFTGQVYVYLGSRIKDTIADVVISNPESANNYFGYSLSNADDLNRDGYDDIMIGASSYQNFKGIVYSYFGGFNMNTEPDFYMMGETANSDFGVSLASAGDFNDDGFPDIVVGADLFNNSTGEAYITLNSVINANPVLLYVKDVPDDQGGVVSLKWTKSSLEISGASNITDYLVYRSIPPGINGFQWVQIADIAAVDFPFYYFDANTLYDSSSNSNSNTYFFIKARNSATGEAWNSNIVFGKSIDNIPPGKVSPFTAILLSNDVSLNWKPVSDPDLLNYILYRSTSPVIDPDTEPVFAVTADSTYLDTSPLSGLYYYFIVAQDIHNNKGPVSVAESPNIAVNLTLFIQGFYYPDEKVQVSDTLRAYLRSSVSPYLIIDSLKAVVSDSGKAVLNFGDAPTGNYYLVITHRNSIETWSSSGLNLISGNTVSYNFSTVSSQAYGNNMAEIDDSPLRFGIFGGDENQDGFVDLTDVVNVFDNAQQFINGYVITDMNGDNITDLTDVLITFNNSSAFVSKVTP